LPKDDGSVDISEGWVRIEAIGKPERKRDKEADEIGDRDELVLGADGEGFARDTPCDGQCVELLDVLSRPDVGASQAYQNWGLVFDDR